jgi:membrane protease YdiL (CAAX protease family)
VRNRFQAFAFKCASYRYTVVRRRSVGQALAGSPMALPPPLPTGVAWNDVWLHALVEHNAGKEGWLCVALSDAHWPAMYREPMTVTLFYLRPISVVVCGVDPRLSADVVEMFVGLGVLYQCLRPYFPLPKRWFPISLKGKWFKEILLGCTVFPIVSTLNNLNSSLMPIPSTTLPVSPWEQSLMSNDLVSICFYVVVVSFVAPVWEEMIFRGFLLPSFTRYFRIDVAILFSSLIFALAHFSMERLIPLTFLGMLMCVVYIRSKNILAPIILHSLWNAFAFVELIIKPEEVMRWLVDVLI